MEVAHRSEALAQPEVRLEAAPEAWLRWPTDSAEFGPDSVDVELCHNVVDFGPEVRCCRALTKGWCRVWPKDDRDFGTELVKFGQDLAESSPKSVKFCPNLVERGPELVEALVEIGPRLAEFSQDLPTAPSPRPTRPPHSVRSTTASLATTLKSSAWVETRSAARRISDTVHACERGEAQSPATRPARGAADARLCRAPTRCTTNAAGGV